MQRLSELGVAYRGSPIVEGARERCFDNSLRGGDGIRSRFLLVVGDDAESATEEAVKQLAQSFTQIVELPTDGRQGVTLVRPDGYMAYAAPNGDSITAYAMECIRVWSAKQNWGGLVLPGRFKAEPKLCVDAADGYSHSR